MSRILLLVAFALVIMTGCKSTKDTTSSGGSNGGVFKKKILTGMSITGIEVKRFAPYGKDGSQWDAYAPFATDPDLYVTLKQLGLEIYRSEAHEECKAGNSQRFYLNLPYEIKAFTNEIMLELFDEDGISNDDNVGYLTFRPIDYEKQELITLKSADGTMEVLLQVKWNYV
ncbi:MAG: hypothetical protein ACOYLH_08550 [Flavobacteriales bacterium]